MSNGVRSHSEVGCGDLHTLSGQGTQGVRLGTATIMLTHSHTNGNSDETSASGTSSIRVPSRSARGSSLSPLLSGTVLEQVSPAVPAPGVDVEGRLRRLTASPATAAAARAADASAPSLHRRVQGMMPVRLDNGEFLSLNRTAAIASPVRNARYFRIGKVPIVKLDDPRGNKLPPYANSRPGTVRIAPPDDVLLSTILATSEVSTTSKELKEKPTDVTSVLQVLKAKSRKRCLLDRCDSSYDRAASNPVDKSIDYFSTDAVSDQRRDSKRRRLEEEEDKKEISCEPMETTAAGSSPIGGTKGSAEAADSAHGKNRARAVGPARAQGSEGLDYASRRNAIASSYSALLPVVRAKSQRKSGAVDLSAEESSEESVSRNGSTILVKSLAGTATQRSGTPASATGGINSSSRSLVSDAAATDGGSLEQKGAGDVCGTPPSSGRVPLMRRNPEIFHHLTDRFKNVPKATFTPSLEDYAIDELADRERLSRMVGGTFVAPAVVVSVAMAAGAAGKPQLSALAASAPSSISAADKVPALASTVIVPSLSAPSETSALGLRTTTSAEKTTSMPSSFSIGGADVTSGNDSSSAIAPRSSQHATDSGVASSTSSSAGPLQPASLFSVSTSQPPPPPTYESATASSGGTAAAVPVSIGLSSAVVAPAQGATATDQGPVRPPLLFGNAGVSSAASSLGNHGIAVTAFSSGTSSTQSSVVSSSAQSETQPTSAGLATMTKITTTVGASTFALPLQSFVQPLPSTATTAASSIAKSTPFANSMTTLSSQTTMGSEAGGIASSTTTAAAAGSLNSSCTAASSVGPTPAAGAAATSNASGVAAFSFPSAFTTGSGSLFGAASRLGHASSTAAAVSGPSKAAAPSLPTFGSGSASLFGSSFGGKPSTSGTADGGAQKQLTFTFGSATNGALPAAAASSAPATSSALATSSAPVTSSVLAAPSVPATSSAPAGSSAPAAAFTFDSGLLGATKDKDTVTAGVGAAAATTFAFGSGLFSATKDKDAAAAAGSSASTAAAALPPTFTFGGSGLFSAAKEKDSPAPSATAAAAAPASVVPPFSFGSSGSSVAAKDVPGTSSSMPGLAFAFGSNGPFGAAKDAATATVTFGAGSVFGGAAGVAAQPPVLGGGSTAPTAATALPQPSSGVFGTASAVKGIGGTFGGTAASAVGAAPLLFGVSSSATAPPATSIATTAVGASGMPAASATAVAPSFGVFGSTTLPAASTASTVVGAPSGSSSSVFGGLFGAGKVAGAATTAGSGVHPALPFAFGQSTGASGTSSAGPTLTFGLGQAQLPPTASAGTGSTASQQAATLSGAAQPAGQQQPALPFAFGQSTGASGTSSARPTLTFGLGQAQLPPTASAGTGTAASQQAATLSGAAQPAGQQQPAFSFGSAAATAPSTAGSSNLFGTPAATGTPAAFNFSFGGGNATAQPAAQSAKTSGFNFGNATSPGSTFVFGAQANSAAAGATTPAASAFGMSPASFGATVLSSLPTGDQGSFTNIFTSGSASNSAARQRQAVRRTGVAGRLGKR